MGPGPVETFLPTPVLPPARKQPQQGEASGEEGKGGGWGDQGLPAAQDSGYVPNSLCINPSLHMYGYFLNYSNLDFWLLNIPIVI